MMPLTYYFHYRKVAQQTKGTKVVWVLSNMDHRIIRLRKMALLYASPVQEEIRLPVTDVVAILLSLLVDNGEGSLLVRLTGLISHVPERVTGSIPVSPTNLTVLMRGVEVQDDSGKKKARRKHTVIRYLTPHLAR